MLKLVSFYNQRALIPTHNRTPFLLSLLGGILLITSGAGGAIGVFDKFIEDAQLLFGSGFVFTFAILVGILAVLMILAGVGVIIGGFILTGNRFEDGRIIILVSVCMGILGLIVTLFQAAVSGNLVMDWSTQTIQSMGWLGAIFALVARIIAEQKPISEQK